MKTFLFFLIAGLVLIVLFVSLALGESVNTAFIRSIEATLFLSLVFLVVLKIRTQVRRWRNKKPDRQSEMRVAAFMEESAKIEMSTQVPDLIQIASRGTLEEVERAIRNSLDINARNEIGFTALMWAAQSNPDPAVVSLLLRSGANMNAVSDHGLTALMLAAEFNPNPAMVSVLLEAGAQAGAATMLAATLNPNPQVFPLVLRAGVDVNARDEHGNTALMRAAGSKVDPEKLSLHSKLLAHLEAHKGEEIEALRAAKDFSTFAEAASNLIANDYFSGSDLEWAVRADKSILIISLLLKAGAEINARNKNGRTALMAAAGTSFNPAVISLLLKWGADISAADNTGQTALGWGACNPYNPEVVSVLLRAGANARTRDVNRRTPYDYAKINPKLKGTVAKRKLWSARFRLAQLAKRQVRNL